MKINYLPAKCFKLLPKPITKGVITSCHIYGFDYGVVFHTGKYTPTKEGEYEKAVGISLYEDGFVLNNCLLLDLRKKKQYIEQISLEEFSAKQLFKIFVKKLFKKQ